MGRENLTKLREIQCHVLFVLLLSCMLLYGFGQSVDSLERELSKNSHDVAKRITIYNSLTIAYRDLDFSKSIHYGKLGLKLAEKENDEKGILKLYSNMAGSYFRAGIYDTAEFYLEKGGKLARKLEESRFEAIIFVTYGAIYQERSLYDSALESFHQAARILESEKDSQGLCSVYSNIGGIYQILRKYEPALEYFNKAEQLAIKENNQTSLANIYISLSDIFLHQTKKKEKALDYAQKALQISEKIDHKFNEVSALQMLSKVYYYTGEAKEALPIAKNALLKTRALGFPDLISQSLVDLSNTYFFLKDYVRSADYALESLHTDSTDANVAMNAYANLIQTSAYQGYPDLTERYLKNYRDVVDGYANDSYQNALSALEVKYETEKKELKIEALEQKNRFHIWLSIAGGVILLIALVVAFMRYRLAVSKRKLAEKETQRLEQEKKLVAVQATLDGEAAERTRLARDLHDGLGSMLSAIKINLPQVNGGAHLEAVDVSRFQKAIGMLDESIQELRRVAHHMMPETLLRYGLKVSLSDFCTAIPIVNFHYFGDEVRLPEKMEIMVYRCVHELVNNALKHADANQINVQLVQASERLSFTVQDDGRGFDQNTAEEGMGLLNVRQRVEAFHGKIEIYSSTGGTEIHVEINLENMKDHD